VSSVFKNSRMLEARSSRPPSRNLTFLPFCFLLLLIFFAVSCGSKEADEKPPLVTIESGADRADDLSVKLEIVWNYWYMQIEQPSDSPLIVYLNERFNVSASCRPARVATRIETQIEEAANGWLPDIFEVFADWDILTAAGGMRPIPRHMVETYAPRYAMLLNDENEWDKISARRNGFPNASEGDIAFLPGYCTAAGILGGYSVYKWDLLREAGIIPNGEVNEIHKNVFFCAEPFTFDQFQIIIEKVLPLMPGGRAFSLTGDWIIDREKDLFPLWGMFGIGGDFVEEDGNVVPVYASRQYRAFLEFVIERARRHGIFIIDEESKEYGANAFAPLAVWFSKTLPKQPGYGFTNFMSEINSMPRTMNGVFLVVPPEINIFSKHEAAPVNGGRYFTDEKFAVGSQVSDEKLARLLTMFDELTFDDEVYWAAEMGIEGVHYDMQGRNSEGVPVQGRNSEGVPVQGRNSEGVPEQGSEADLGMNRLDGGPVDYVGRFYTNVRPEEPYFRIRRLLGAEVTNILALHAAGTGSEIITPAYRAKKDRALSDALSDFYLINNREDICQAVQNYYYGVVADGSRTLAEWDLYINELDGLGLRELIEIYTEHMVLIK